MPPQPTGPNPHDPALPYFETTPWSVADFERAPVKYVSHANLRCSPATLFAILEDEDAWTRWAPGIVGVEWTSPKPFGAGTTRTVRFVRGMAVYEKFTVWEPGRELAFTLTGATQPVWHSFGEHYLVTDHGDGTCRLTWTVVYAPRDTFAKIHFLIRPLMGLAFKYYMKRLEKVAAKWQAAEAAQPQEPPAEKANART